MSDRAQHLLFCLGEEAGEIGQMVGKIGRFGLKDRWPDGGSPNNNERLIMEVNDLLAVVEMLGDEGVDIALLGDREAIARKKVRVEKYMRYASECREME